jgi:hypothetical protein
MVECSPTGEVKVFIDGNTGNSSTGDVGSQHGTTGLIFSSNDVVKFANGFSTIHPNTGVTSFQNLDIQAVVDTEFKDLTFDAQMAHSASQGLTATTLEVETFLNGTNEGNFTFNTTNTTQPGGTHGLPHDTDLRFEVLNPTGLTSVDLVALSNSGIKEVKQIKVSGFTGVVVPEPSTFALMVLGVVGVGLAGYRRTRRTRLERDFLWHGNAASAEELPGAIA